MPVSTLEPRMMSMSPFGEVMYGTVLGLNRLSQLVFPGTYGWGLSRYGLMFCSMPLGMLPEVTGPYCSQTRSGAAPPEAWLSTVALDWVIDALLFGSQVTVTPLWAASYCWVSCCRPALSADVIAPVLGGSTALMTTDPLPPPLPDEPPDEQAAARMSATASAVAADSVLLRVAWVVTWFIAKLTSG